MVVVQNVRFEFEDRAGRCLGSGPEIRLRRLLSVDHSPWSADKIGDIPI